MRRPFNSRLMCAASAAALMLVVTGAASAQDAAKPASSDEATVVIVTGRAGGAATKKLEAGYSVTTLSPKAIDILGPKTTGEVLTAVPGVWVESSGGSATSNIFVRGIPSTGDAPFVTMQFNGVPVYGANSPSFMDQTAMVRLDETISTVEAVNGGPASTFSDGQPGLTTNLILKEGTDVTAGDVKLTATDYGSRRIEGYMSGKLADDWYVMAGGYASTGDTVRKAGFDTEKGGQFTVNLTHKFATGKFNVFARYTDDHGEWFLPFATQVPGINIGTYNQLNNYTRYATIVTPGSAGSGATEQVDLGDGRGWKGTVAGGSFSDDLGNGVQIVDHFGVTDGTLQTTGLVPQGAGAITVATALATPANRLTAGQTTVSGIHTGQALASTDYVQQFGAWIVEKKLRAVTNDAALNFTVGTNKITAGYYFSHFSSDDAWSLGDNTWMQVGGSADIVNLNNGALGGYAIADSGTADINAIYLADSWNVTDALRLDGALRYQQQKINFVILGGNPGQNELNPKQDQTSWTLGANYKVQSNFDVYVRASQGYHFPSFDDVRSELESPIAVSQDKPWNVKSLEAGMKFHNHAFDADVSVFDDKVVGAVYADVGVPPVVAGSKTTGLEFDGRWTSDFGLSVTTNDVIENAKTDAPTQPDFNNKLAERIPSYQARITPTYEWHVGNTKATLYGTYMAIGKRYSDLANTQVLPAYSTVSAGILVDWRQLTFQLAGDNLGNSHGLTEGNPRFLAGPGAAIPDVRPIFGRSWTASVTWHF